jgi:hypothetical protein
MKNFKNVFFFVSLIVYIYILLNYNSIDFYFDNVLGRALILLLIISNTSCNTTLGFISVLLLVIVHNSKSYEGLENMSKPVGSKDTEKDKLINKKNIKNKENEKEKDKMINKNNINNNEKTKDKTNKKGKEGFQSSIKPSPFGNERNRIITMESYMKPKQSNSLMFSINKNDENSNPVSNEPGKDGFTSYFNYV